MPDAEWAVVRPLLRVPGWLRGRGGQPEAYCHRAMLDAIRYLVDSGTKWRAMPADFPPWDGSKGCWGWGGGGGGGGGGVVGGGGGGRGGGGAGGGGAAGGRPAG
ncbi:transposase, partial [Streptomyces avidinii]|uniref:transposase n=1 Tax=Streptomyces avidinii TaxID=1895 RepID=UPI00379E5B08